MFRNVDDILEMARRRGKKRTVAVAAAHQEHVLQAVMRAKNDGFVEPILIGDKKEIIRILTSIGESLDEKQIYDKPDTADAASTAVDLINSRDADFIMKGIMNTADVLKAVLNKKTGLPHGKVVTHLALTELPGYHKMVGLCDCAVIPYPNFEQKIAQIEAVTNAMHNMGYDNKMIFGALAAAEELNLKVVESVEAAKLKQLNLDGAITGCRVEGPISLDLALSTEKAKEKGYSSFAAGNVDALLFPNLISGSVYAKAIELMGASPLGILLGASVPITITSRAASAELKYNSLVVTSTCVR
ncbi:phosphate butyryltransferase [Fusibacter paucivorans]|uniref:Phosphate butyryltransferase n=1 Tax=Fusibacter paucivorans TaxID=76009 RepID=A0ABS5PRZ6_9FIRM|nr:phosphate acyltransferase [Fusibacter paucivorans]MBS7527933.1 phosphate butyryltransferase [Fusibacter paucivorans]